MDAQTTWPDDLYQTLKAANITHMSYVPDAGHTRLINLLSADNSITCNVLTTEEEGIALAAGAWLGGQRSVLLLQSSGVGNCINMLSLSNIGRFPMLMLVTMRGEYEEFNPWQVPMGQGTEPALNAVGVRTFRAGTAEELIDLAGSASAMAFASDQQIAILISQQLLGKKKW